MQPQLATIAALALTAAALSAQQALTVPSGNDQADAASLLWVAGFTANVRQQTVIDARHLQPLVGRTITAMSWRRDAQPEPFAGGMAQLTIRLAHSGLDSLSASPSFAANLGSNSHLAFAGLVTIPAAPPLAPPATSWAATHAVRVSFSSPFVYQGGNLIVDVVGSTVVGQSTPWWPADAVWDGTTGSEQTVGIGSGVHANQLGQWASLSPRSLVPGATAQLWARGTENGLAIAFVGGVGAAPGVPVTAFVPEAMPQSRIYLPLPAQMFVTTFSEILSPGDGGVAHLRFHIPNQPWALGATFGSQWLDVQQNFATSNAANGAISTVLPTLGMSTITGAAGDVVGSVSITHAHVMRFDYQ